MITDSMFEKYVELSKRLGLDISGILLSPQGDYIEFHYHQPDPKFSVCWECDSLGNRHTRGDCKTYPYIDPCLPYRK